ncbi:MAG TPA: protease modulator HflC [Planctomycetaceae bacterium]|nr:protease modulator HflC [Planctomycetaceae bacterium]
MNNQPSCFASSFTPTDRHTAETRRRAARFFAGLLLAAGLVFLVASSVVFVDETELVLIERMGDIVAAYDRQADRGLKFKLPWPIETVRRFDRRRQLYDPPGREIFTRDRKNIVVDAYVVWRIADSDESASGGLSDRPVVKFFRGLGSTAVAEARLDSRLRSALGTVIGQVEFSGDGGLFHVADSESGPADAAPGRLAELAATIREHILHRSREADSLREQLGIEIVDVGIKRPNLPAGNQQAVYERMKSERRKIAQRYRSAGLAESTVIRSQAKKQAGELLARAGAEAERIRGEAEAEAIRILNAAHAEDPEFYRLVRTLDSYRKILNPKTTLVLSASSNLLKLLTEGIPDEPSVPATPVTPTAAARGGQP